MQSQPDKADVVIVGGGIAGIVTALELLDHKHRVILLDRDDAAKFGGLAKESFGGIFMVGTPQQKLMGIKDSPDLALQDWLSFAEFEPDAIWPRRWAEHYVQRSRRDVYDWLSGYTVHFFPVVHWVERGLYVPGNSVPRFHMVWGTGHGLIERLVGALLHHPHADRLETRFRHRVTDILTHDGQITGVRGQDEASGTDFEIPADVVVIAAGGICGDIDRVRQHWYAPWGDPPTDILNGSHRYANGEVLDLAAGMGANVTHLNKHWHYAAGVHHPDPQLPEHGLSLVPPRSALWVNYRGERFGPQPLITGYDTRYLVEQICRQPVQYSWQIMNWKIAKKELAVSGAEFNDAIRDRKIIPFLKNLLLGNEQLVQRLSAECPDFVVADTLDELVEKMNAQTGEAYVNPDLLRDAIARYDATIRRGAKFHNDDQLRRIAHLRQYRGDRVRTCKFQPILDPNAMPLIAIREFILSRKSLGGIQTDLACRVLCPPQDGQQAVIDGLYAVGEAAGFGGGGVHGLRALEGTFLGTCILTGRVAAQSIAGATS